MPKVFAWIKAQATSPLAFKVYRTFLVSFVAVWASLGNAITITALVAAAAAGGTAVLNGYVVPAWRQYKGNTEAGAVSNIVSVLVAVLIALFLWFAFLAPHVK